MLQRIRSHESGWTGPQPRGLPDGSRVVEFRQRRDEDPRILRSMDRHPGGVPETNGATTRVNGRETRLPIVRLWHPSWVRPLAGRRDPGVSLARHTPATICHPSGMFMNRWADYFRPIVRQRFVN